MPVDTNVTATGDDDTNKKNKLVENDEEEPRSKIPSDDAPPSEDAPSPSAPSPSAPKLCDLPSDFDVFCINKFDIVTVGEEAGWPGQWEEVVNEEISEEQLLYALQVKGSVMSDEAWQQHWGQVGPSLLAAGWVEQYPTIPLAQVERATGVSFLTWSDQSRKLTDAVEQLSLSENSVPSEGTENKEEVNASVDPPDLSGLSINENTTKSEDHSTLELVASDGKITDESIKPQQQNFSNEQVAEMWSNFYNEYYWDCYKKFVGVVGGAPQQFGENLIEDHVAAKRHYEPADILVEPEEEPADSKIPLAPDSSTAVEQNVSVVKTDQVNSEPAVEVIATKDSSVDVNTSQNGTQSCFDPQEECKKETSDLHECKSQTEELPSQEDSKIGLPNRDSQEHREEEKLEELPSKENSKNGLPDSQEHHGEEESKELPSKELSSQEDSKNGPPNTQGNCREEEINPEQLSNGKDDQPPPIDSNKKTTPKPEAKAIWQLSKSAQYTSIVWVLQEAGIISDETSSEVVNDQTACSDQVHCNGAGSDKETNDCEDNTNTNETSKVVSRTSSDVIPSSSSSAIDDSHNQSKQPLKRKR